MKRVLVALAASSLLLSGCYTLSYDLTSLPDDAAQMTPSAEGTTGRHFVAEDKAYFLLSGLVPVSKPDLSAIVQREGRGKRVQNLKIKSEQSFTDGLVAFGLGMAAGLIASGMTAAGGGTSSAASAASLVSAGLGLLIPQMRTITIEGDVLNESTPKR